MWSNQPVILHYLHVCMYVNPVGKKGIIGWKIHFLRYSTGESGMIVELFSQRLFIKILFCRPTISISRFRITTYFTGNFPEISRKFFGNFPENSWPPTYPPYLPPISFTHTQPPKPWTHPELQIQFSQMHIFCWIMPFFPTGFKYKYQHQLLNEHKKN